MKMLKSRTFLTLFSVSILVAACATNPVTGKKEYSLMSEQQEIEIGKQLDAEVRREMGLYEDAELQRYVSEVGMRLARSSHRPNLDWHFAVLDQPAVNAFALPGGYIYLTRGIMPFLANEAELAGVLGHEIGHVTARHSAQAYTKATTAGVGLTVLSIFVPAARPVQGLTETAFGVLFLKHGRDAELQADSLGAEYSAKTGWDPAGIQGMLTTLSRLDEASSSRRGVPGWLSTHPNPADRVEKVQANVREHRQKAGDRLTADEAGYLRHIDGIVFGDNPDEGVVRGNDFLHADLRFALTFPEGWEITNTKEQVVAQMPGDDVFMVLQLVPEARGTIEDVAVGTMRNAGFRHIGGDRASINGLDAYVGTYQGKMQGVGQVVTRAAHIAHGRNVYVLAGLAKQDTFSRVDREIIASIRSFRALSRNEAADIRPNRVDLYVVREGDTWQSIAARAGAGNIKASTLAIMNHYPVNEPPRAGDRIKIVVAG